MNTNIFSQTSYESNRHARRLIIIYNYLTIFQISWTMTSFSLYFLSYFRFLKLLKLSYHIIFSLSSIFLCCFNFLLPLLLSIHWPTILLLVLLSKSIDVWFHATLNLFWFITDGWPICFNIQVTAIIPTCSSSNITRI